MRDLRLELLRLVDDQPSGYPTWWAPLDLAGVTTAQARAEFKKLEADGVVARSSYSSSNNIRWVRAAAQVTGGAHA